MDFANSLLNTHSFEILLSINVGICKVYWLSFEKLLNNRFIELFIRGFFLNTVVPFWNVCTVSCL